MTGADKFSLCCGVVAAAGAVVVMQYDIGWGMLGILLAACVPAIVRAIIGGYYYEEE
jgi:hypothetical protein